MTSWTAEKTILINVNGVATPINTLPADIQFDILTYDRMRQELMDIIYNEKKVNLAIRGMLSEIENKILKYNEPKRGKNDDQNTGKEQGILNKLQEGDRGADDPSNHSTNGSPKKCKGA
jgi:hypothetical protein